MFISEQGHTHNRRRVFLFHGRRCRALNWYASLLPSWSTSWGGFTCLGFLAFSETLRTPNGRPSWTQETLCSTYFYAKHACVLRLCRYCAISTHGGSRADRKYTYWRTVTYQLGIVEVPRVNCRLVCFHVTNSQKNTTHRTAAMLPLPRLKHSRLHCIITHISSCEVTCLKERAQ